MGPQVLCYTVILLESIHEVLTQQLTRIPLESNDQLRFTGAVRLGSLHSFQWSRMVFDTGSSDTWVTAKMRHGRSWKAFAIGYGDGSVSGFAARTDLQLGWDPASSFHLRDVPVGFVDDPTSVMAGLDADGVLGLGMEALAQIYNRTSLLDLLADEQSLTGSVVFSIFISDWSGAYPASQLILGGQDPALVGTNTLWFSFPVISHDALHRSPFESTKTSFGFWALRMQNLAFGNVTLSLGPKNCGGAALFDSGTSALLLPQHVFDSIVQVLSTQFGARLLSSFDEKRSLPACQPCQAHEFPSLAFDFLTDGSTTLDVAKQRFELQGSDYVRCDQRRRECTAMIDAIHSSEISNHLDVMILGAVFFRAFYTRFDYSNKQVSLACTLDNNDICRGGLKPALDYRGRPNGPYREPQQLSRIWVGICAAVTALLLLAGFRILLQS